MTYMNAELELVRFAAEDVLATSNDQGCGSGEDFEGFPDDCLMGEGA